MALNKKQSAFIDAYFATNLNALQAYKNSYGVTDDNVAAASASRLLTNVNVAAEITKRQAIISAKFDLTRDRMIEETLKLIKSSVEEGLDGSGIIKDRTNWAKGIEMLNKIAGLYQNKVDITSKGDKVKINLNLTDEPDNS